MQYGCRPQDIPLRTAFDDQYFLRERLVMGTSITECLEFTGLIAFEVQTVYLY
jgi:hypothetical protein